MKTSLSGNEDEMTLQNVYDLCISLCQQVNDQAKEIKLLKAKITKLKKQAKPVIKHFKAYSPEDYKPRNKKLASFSTNRSKAKATSKEKEKWSIVEGLEDIEKEDLEEEDESESEKMNIPQAVKKFKQLEQQEYEGNRIQAEKLPRARKSNSAIEERASSFKIQLGSAQ
ncbi:hypothetical protein Tco_0344858 [Tanacetum coccineum]